MGAGERIRRTGWLRRAGFGGVVALAVALLMVLPSAVATTPLLYLKAPYSGTNSGSEVARFGGVCAGTSSFARSPVFNLTHGRAYTVAEAQMPGCASSASVLAYESAGFASATFTLPSGHHSIKAKWTVSFSIDLVATPGPTPQSASAYVDVNVDDYVYDETNNTYIGPTHIPSLDYSISTGSYVKSYTNQVLVAYANGTFASGHDYEVSVVITVIAYASVTGGASSASAKVNAGTGGKAATLNVIET
jgi:hypothetical protein